MVGEPGQVRLQPRRAARWSAPPSTWIQSTDASLDRQSTNGASRIDPACACATLAGRLRPRRPRRSCAASVDARLLCDRGRDCRLDPRVRIGLAGTPHQARPGCLETCARAHDNRGCDRMRNGSIPRRVRLTQTLEEIRGAPVTTLTRWKLACALFAAHRRRRDRPRAQRRAATCRRRSADTSRGAMPMALRRPIHVAPEAIGVSQSDLVDRILAAKTRQGHPDARRQARRGRRRRRDRQRSSRCSPIPGAACPRRCSARSARSAPSTRSTC